MTHKVIVVKLPQEVNRERWIEICNLAYPFRHTVTASHDDMMTLMGFGNDDSYVKMVSPTLPSQQESIALLTAAGYEWIEWPEGFRFTNWPTDYRYVTQRFMANPQNYQQFGLPAHEGIDIRAPNNTPIRAVAAGIISDINFNPGNHNYGIFVRVDHGDGYETTYAHLKNVRSGIQVGVAVVGGQELGRANNTGNSWGDHLHLTLKRKGVPAFVDRCGRTWPFDIIDPEPFMMGFTNVYWPQAVNCPAAEFDLTRFKEADPYCWRVVRLADGRTEDVQDMQLGNGLFVRRKGSNGEWHQRRADGYWLIHDTSPAPDSQGNERVYTLYKNGVAGAQKSLLKQDLNQLWGESGTHVVQFRAKNGCHPLPENSGNATNSSKIVRYETNFTFNRYGQNIRFDEVIWEQTGAETQIYAIKDGRSCGWIGWSAPWGESEPVEIYWDRGRLTTEPNRWCPF